MTIFLIVFFILFFLLSLRRPLWAGIFILSTLPSYLIRFSIGPIPFTLLEGMIWLFVLPHLFPPLLKGRMNVFPSFFLKWGVNVFPSFFLKWGVNVFPSPFLRGRARVGVNKKNLPFIILISLFILSGLISVFVAPEMNTALGLFKAYIIEPILFVLIFILLLQNVGARHVAPLQILLYTLGISTIIISLYAIVQKFTGFGIPNIFWAEEETRRVTSFFEYPNALGLYLGPITVLYFGIFLQKSKNVILSLDKVETKDLVSGANAHFIRWIPACRQAGFGFAQDDKILIFLCFFIFTSSFLAIFFAQSEGAIFGIVAGIFMLFFFYLPQWKYRFLFSSAVLLFSFIIILLPGTKNYLAQKISLNDFSGNIRKEMWSETITFLKTEPIFGAGIGGYQNRIAQFHKNQQVEIFLYPHNFFLNFYVEMGLLGLLSVIGLLILFFWRIIPPLFLPLIKGEMQEGVILLTIMVEILVHGIVDAPFFKNDLAIIFLFTLCFGILTNSPKTRILREERAAEE